MKLEIEVVSIEKIKPSLPTPSHLGLFKHCLLDQLIPAPYALTILYYPVNNFPNQPNVLNRVELLKESLSETLTHFYPLAGLIKDDLFINCNDEGAYYVEARVDSSLLELLSQPNLVSLHNLLPTKELVPTESYVGTHVTNIQVNVFKCGGIAIGICISHKVADGAVLSSFIKAWAAITRGCKETKINLIFDTASLFPANDTWLRDSSMSMWGSLFFQGNWVTKRFVFDASAISTLRGQITNSSCAKNPTRIETVSAFIWQCNLGISKQKHGISRPSTISHLVNLRKRMKSHNLSECSLGNLLWIAIAKCPTEDERNLNCLVKKIRDSFSKIDDEFVKSLQGEDRYSVMLKSLKEIEEPLSRGEVDYIGFSSLCNFGFYEADFGWGKPIWVSSVGASGSIFMNLVVLFDTRFGDGIEAWLTLYENDMALFESDPELLKFVSVDPSPLIEDHNSNNTL